MELIWMSTKVLLLTTVVAAAFFDWRTRKIPNVLIGIALVGALILQLSAHGLADGLIAWAAGTAAGMAAFIGLYMLRAMGAGDVKLMGAVGAFVGPGSALTIAVLACLAGGLIAILVMIRRKQGVHVWNSLNEKVAALQSRDLVGLQADKPACHTTATHAHRFPYAAAVGVGTVLAICGWPLGLVH